MGQLLAQLKQPTFATIVTLGNGLVSQNAVNTFIKVHRGPLGRRGDTDPTSPDCRSSCRSSRLVCRFFRHTRQRLGSFLYPLSAKNSCSPALKLNDRPQSPQIKSRSAYWWPPTVIVITTPRVWSLETPWSLVSGNSSPRHLSPYRSFRHSGGSRLPSGGSNPGPVHHVHARLRR